MCPEAELQKIKFKKVSYQDSFEDLIENNYKGNMK